MGQSKLATVLLSNSAVTPGRQSRFLALPGELRNSIIEYTLIEKEGLLIERRTCIEPSPSRVFVGFQNLPEPKESNQVKYACRQLYNETRGLGLRLNDTAFRSSCTERGIDKFMTFLSSCSPRQRESLKTITIWENHGWENQVGKAESCAFVDRAPTANAWFLTLLDPRLIAFAKSSPGCVITVRIGLLNAQSRAVDWMHYGSCLQKALHGSLPNFLTDWERDCAQFKTDIWRIQNGGDVILPRNLRFLPAAEQIDRTLFEEQNIIASPPFSQRSLQTLEELEARYAQAAKWCKEGF